MDNNVDNSIMKLVHQAENNYIQVYSNFKLCSFYEKKEQISSEEINVKRMEKTLEDIYKHNELLNYMHNEILNYNNTTLFHDEFNKQVLKPLKIRAIEDAKKRIVQGRRNKYIKKLLEDDQIDE